MNFFVKNQLCPGQEVETVPLILCVSDDALNHTVGAGPSEHLQLHHCGGVMRIYQGGICNSAAQQKTLKRYSWILEKNCFLKLIFIFIRNIMFSLLAIVFLIFKFLSCLFFCTVRLLF
jgi:hypothetical protein